MADQPRPRASRPPGAIEPAEQAERQARQEAREKRQLRLRAEAQAAVARVNQGRTGDPEGGTEQGAGGRRADAGPSARRRDPLPSRPAQRPDVDHAFAKLFDERQAKQATRTFRKAAQAFQQERFADGAKLLRPLVKSAPGVIDVRELLGLCLYREERWKEAVTQLEAFRDLSGTTEQHPVLADCYRAMGRWRDVEALWEELAEQSPSAALVTEGRIVAAGALADRGRVNDGVRLLEKGWRPPKQPREHHLRRAYALADLYERGGDVPAARRLFDWLIARDRDFGDVRQRRAALG